MVVMYQVSKLTRTFWGQGLLDVYQSTYIFSSNSYYIIISRHGYLKYVMIVSPQHHPALSLIFFLLPILLFPPCCASVSDTNANVRARVANCLDQLFHADVAFWVDSQVRNVRFIDLSIIILQKHFIRDWIGLVQKGF